MITLKTAVENWHRENRAGWKPTTSNYVIRNFEMYIFSEIGHMTLADIRAKHIVDVIENTELTSPDVARRLLGRLILIFDIAIIKEFCEHNPARGVKVILKRRLGGSFAVLDEKYLPGFYRDIDKYAYKVNASELAFWVIQYTALRRSEAVRATWNEINFEKMLWTVPDSRMKNGKTHLVPITTQLLKLLKKCRQYNTTNWVFPSPHKNGENHIHPWSPLYLVRKAGYEKRMTIHGARKVFSTLAHESGKWSIDAIELQLSHAVPGVRGVYNKAQLIDERRELAQWFANKLDRLRYN